MKRETIINKTLGGGVSALVNKAVNKYLPHRDCPGWCFIPMFEWRKILDDMSNNNYRPLPEGLFDELQVNLLATITTWKYTQRIYRIPDILFHELIKTDIKGDVPADVLTRLPDWCVYIEVPDPTAMENFTGFWAHLDYVPDSPPELYILGHMDIVGVEDENDGDFIHAARFKCVLDGTIEDIYKSMVDDARQYIPNFEKDTEAVAAHGEIVKGILSILLYICSDEPEIEVNKIRQQGFYEPLLKKTKKGFLLFFANKYTYCDVGVEISKRLKEYAQRDAPSEHTVRPHVRSAHWHGYWTGKRNNIDRQEFVYRWIAPVFVEGYIRGKHEQ